MRPKMIAFDGDDTLWHNEPIFESSAADLAGILAAHGAPEDLGERLYHTERRNLRLFGYGVKGYTLSMIETALEVTGNAVPGSAIQEIIDLGKSMLEHPVEVIDGVREVLEALGRGYELALITKGDLFDQDFKRIDIVSEKDTDCYRGILGRAGVEASAFMMVGNSMRSDILPVLDLGAMAVHVPHRLTWAHEVANAPTDAPQGFFELTEIRGLPELVARL